MDYQQTATLAWHESLELHEIVVFQSTCLVSMKQKYPNVSNHELKGLYKEVILAVEQNLTELLPFYQFVPNDTNYESRDLDTSFFSADLLIFLKTSIRNYSVAITETATHELRVILTNQLIKAINAQEKVFQFMYRNGYYPAYDLEKLFTNDVKLATKAIKKKY